MVQHSFRSPRARPVPQVLALVCGLVLAGGNSISAEPIAGLPQADAVFAQHDPQAIALGQLLFYDPILSGNRGVSCASCHHPRFGTSDGLSLGMGDGGAGLGPDRHAAADNRPEERIPRNAPALFNLGAAEFTRFFHDGRLEDDPSRPHGIRTPLGEDMVQGFDNALSAQAMFPVLSPDEMAGHYGENEVSKSVRMGFLAQPGGAWDRIAGRVAAIPDYRAGFDEVLGPDQPIRFADIANVIAAFMAHEWRADDSPFDRYLRGQGDLPPEAEAGLALFYGRAQCSTCHAGQFQTDHQFHAIAMPQIGPGKKARFEDHHRDTGRMRVTGAPEDAYAFRTPSLRHVTETAPYGHSGAYATLEAVVRHHLDPVAALKRYDPAQAVLIDPQPADLGVMGDADEVAAIAAANRLAPVDLTDTEVAQLLAFLAALTDPQAAKGRLGVPVTVPSGLPVDH